MGELVERTRRRVQVVGGSTLVVSLPKTWARQHGLSAGSEVEIEILPDASLRLKPVKEVKEEQRDLLEASIEVGDSDTVEGAIKQVIAYYVAGFRRIRISVPVERHSMLKDILEVVHKKVLGLESIDEDSRSIVLHSIIDTGFMDLEKAMAKLVRTVSGMMQDVVSAMKTYNANLLHTVIERDDLVDKLYLLIIKQLTEDLIDLRQRFVKHPALCIYIASTAKSIERIADHTVRIAKVLLSTRVEVPQTFVKMLEDSVELFNRVVRAFLERDAGRALNAVNSVHALKKKLGMVSISSVPPSNQCVLLYVIEAIRRVLAYTIDIAETLLDLIAVEQRIESYKPRSPP